MLENSLFDTATITAKIIDVASISERKDGPMSVIETTPQQLIPAGTWVVDPVHTTVGFQVTETTDLFSTINGRFTDSEGRLEGGESPSITGTVHVASLRT